jgi:ribosomal subunit interface protein
MEIHWRNVEAIERETREQVGERLRALEGDHEDLIDVRIVAKMTGHHRHGGQEVRITAQARGKELVAARTRDDVGQALNEAVDVFEREVWRMRHRRTQRRSERPAESSELGIVDRVFADESYGFILTDSGEQVYFHRNAVRSGLDFEALEEGFRVGLNFEAGEEGLQATAVVPPPPDAHGP